MKRINAEQKAGRPQNIVFAINGGKSSYLYLLTGIKKNSKLGAISKAIFKS